MLKPYKDHETNMSENAIFHKRLSKLILNFGNAETSLFNLDSRQKVQEHHIESLSII
jgi:hypothetical protein